MFTINSLATVPAALLLLLPTLSAQSSSVDAKPWILPNAPNAGLGSRSKEDPRPRIRETQHRPVAVRKMGEDENEMFFPRYWQIDARLDNMNDDQRSSDRGLALRLNKEEITPSEISNASMARRLQAPFALHSEQQLNKHPIFGMLPRALFLLQERQSGCPTGTADCSSIGAFDSCCPSGNVCQSITDTGKGDVGCCAEGVDCNSDEVSDCQVGYQSCPDSLGGGCCIPGYTCVGSVCLQAATTTVLVNPTVYASPTTAFNSSSKIPISTTTTIVPAIITTTSTTASATPTPAPTSSTMSPSSSDTESDPSMTTSAIVNAPVRPTSAATSTVTTTSDTSCPTGFYMCLAYYHGGCCRVGRDCALSDCPASASTTVANTNGVTIVAPTGNKIGAATAGLGTGSCATGWTSCPGSLNGGCCPGGYGCATGTSCTATVAGETPSVGAKEPTSDGKKMKAGRWGAAAFLMGAAVLGQTI